MYWATAGSTYARGVGGGAPPPTHSDMSAAAEAEVTAAPSINEGSRRLERGVEDMLKWRAEAAARLASAREAAAAAEALSVAGRVQVCVGQCDVK